MKLPRKPPDNLTIHDSDLVDWPHRLMTRIHGTTGPFALPWYELRHFGPTSTRFDPHPPPPAIYPDFAAMYAAADLNTALAEVFQRGRTVQRTAPNMPHLTVWRPARALRLLDVRGDWPIRQGASHALNTGPHAVCRGWANAIATHPQRVDGILYTSSMTGRDAAVLFLPAANAFPLAPDMSPAINDPGLVNIIAAAATRIRYAIS